MMANENTESTIEIPCLWKREKSAKNGHIYYVSPSGQVLCSIEDLNAYLNAPFTCKCSLREDYSLVVENVFNFDPNIDAKTIHGGGDQDESPCEKWIKNTFENDASFELYMIKCVKYLTNDLYMDKVDMYLDYQRRKYQQSKIIEPNHNDNGCQNNGQKTQHKDDSITFDNYNKKIKRKQLLDQTLKDYHQWSESFDIDAIKLTTNGWLLARDFQPRFIRHLAREFSSSGLIHIDSFPQFGINHYAPSILPENFDFLPEFPDRPPELNRLVESFDDNDDDGDEYDLHVYFNDYNQRSRRIKRNPYIHSKQTVFRSEKSQEIYMVELIDQYGRSNRFRLGEKNSKGKPRMIDRVLSTITLTSEPKIVEENCVQIPIHMLQDYPDGSIPLFDEDYYESGSEQQEEAKDATGDGSSSSPNSMVNDEPLATTTVENCPDFEFSEGDDDVDDHDDEDEEMVVEDDDSDQSSIIESLMESFFEIDDCFRSENSDKEYDSNGEEYEDFSGQNQDHDVPRKCSTSLHHTNHKKKMAEESIKIMKNIQIPLPEAITISDPSRFQRNYSKKLKITAENNTNNNNNNNKFSANHHHHHQHHRLKYIKRMKRLKRELEIQGMPNELKVEEKIRLSPPPSILQPEERVFRTNDIVWGPFGDVRFWPGKLLPKEETIGQSSNDKMLIVQWFGTKQVTTIHADHLRTLTEGLEAHHCARKRHRNGKRVNVSLELAIQEAMSELDNSDPIKCSTPSSV